MRIVISGTVGIGKSTTTEALVKRLRDMGYTVNHLTEEAAESIYLKYFYDAPQEWAFIAQLDFLLGRFKQWLTDEEDREKNPGLITVYDRHFLDDYVFAELHSIKQNISMYNSLTYQAVYKELLEKMAKMDARPDHFIMLRAPLETVVERLRSRGREEETEVDMEYWEDLYKNYYTRPMFLNHFTSNSKNYSDVETEQKSTEEIVDEIIKLMDIKPAK